MYSKERAYSRGILDGLQPDPHLQVSEWADQYRILPTESSAEPGRWRTSRTPYLREIMDALSPHHPAETIVLMKGSQVGGSEIINNFVGYIIHLSPGPTMLVQPTIEISELYSKQRIAPMIDSVPEIQERFKGFGQSRDSSDTILLKEFRGGMLRMAGANSAKSLRSMPARRVLMDEVDAYPLDLDGEGDPISLAKKRANTFANRKIVLVSSPTVEGLSRIESEYESTSQKRYFCPCPHCNHMDWWRMVNIKWPKGEPQKAALWCENCGAEIPETHKTWMLENGEWRDTAQGGDPKKVGYHLSGLYSPLGWYSWADAAREFDESRNNPEMLKTFINTVLGETWKEKYSAKAGADELKERAGGYDLLQVPEGGLLLTAGVDVQDNRLEYLVRAWGRGERSWLVNYGQIFGDPARLDVWNTLADVLGMEYKHASGNMMRVRAAAIDSGGHFTAETYDFARRHSAKHYFAIKGMSDPDKPIIGKPTKVDIQFEKTKLEKAADLYPIGPNAAKTQIYGRLRNPDQEAAGAYHWPRNLPDDYFTQLTAEKKVHRMVNNRPKVLWEKKSGARNESFDMEVYALAALHYFYKKTNPATMWDRLEAIVLAKPENGEGQTREKSGPRRRKGTYMQRDRQDG